MPTPSISSVAPSVGLSLGGTFVTITGSGFNLVAEGRVEVRFAGVLATDVQVVSPTKILCLSPPGVPATPADAIDIEVKNLTPNPPGPDLEQTNVRFDAFTYKRPDLSTPDASQYSEVSLVIRTLVDELRRTVLLETHHDMHPDYADEASALLAMEKQAVAPSLTIVGPEISRDPLYDRGGQHEIVPGAPGQASFYSVPEPVKLTFSYVGVGRTSGEATALFKAVARFFRANSVFRVTQGSESAELELAEVWDERASFRSKATRKGVSEFTGQFVVRGVQLLSEKIGETREVIEDVVTEFEQKP